MSTGILDHCAVMTQNIEASIELFTHVFGMTIRKTEMKESTIHQVWFEQGLQLTQSETAFSFETSIVHHIGICIDDVEACLLRAKEFGATELPKGKNWLVFPFGLCIEVLPLRD